MNFRAIAGGAEMGLAAAIWRTALLPAAAIYGQIAWRNRLRQEAGRQGLPRPVVSVGNLAVGGTGKTPLVLLLARRLAAAGHRPALLCRGYGSGRDGDDNDECRMIRRVLPELPLGVGRDRHGRALALLKQRPEIDVFILDDGFQHTRLRRDLDIVLLDARHPLGNGECLPAGVLREPPKALARAHMLVLTRADRADEQGLQASREGLARFSEAPLIAAVHRPVGLRDAAGQTHPPTALKDRPVFGACAIADPEDFRRSLLDLGCRLVGERADRDHRTLGPRAIAATAARARELGAAVIVITAKDAPKWPAEIPEGPPVWILEMELELIDPADRLGRALSALLPCPVHVP